MSRRPLTGFCVSYSSSRPLVHQFERRLGRALHEEEHTTLRERLGRLGANRVGDVVLDLSAAALGAWLADPDAI